MVTGHSHPLRGKHQRAIGVFPNYEVTQRSLHRLKAAGFPMAQVSVITREPVSRDTIAGAEVHDSTKPDRVAHHTGNKADEGASVGATTGGVLGGLTGLLVGLGTLAIPGIGPIILTGAAATTLATTLAGGAIGAVTGGLIGALVGLGIPEERARVYSDRIARGEYLVMVEGNDEQIAFAERILHQDQIEEYGIYDAPGVTPPLEYTHDIQPVQDRTVVQQSTVQQSTVPVATSAVTARKQAIGVFSSPYEADQAIADLHREGFPLSQVVLIAPDTHQWHPYSGITLRDRFDASQFDLPGDRVSLYQNRFNQSNYLIVVNGQDDEVRRAATLLNRHPIQDWYVYDVGRSRMAPPAPPSVIPPAAAPQPLSTATSTGTLPLGTAAKQAIGVLPHARNVEQAIAHLRRTGFPMQQVFLTNQHFDRLNLPGGVNRIDHLSDNRFAIPADHERFYADQFQRDRTIVVIRGSDDDIHHAAMVLNYSGIQVWQVYQSTASGFAPLLLNRSLIPSTTPPGMQHTDPRLTMPVHPTDPLMDRGDRSQVSTVRPTPQSPDVISVDRRNQQLT